MSILEIMSGSHARTKNSTVALIEHHSLVPVEQHPVLDVPTHGTGEHNLFQIAAFLQQVVKRITVRDAHHVLLDDRTVVEYLGDVVAGRADQLHPPCERLVIGFGANESGQKGVMDVDDALRIPVHEFIGENLHVARQHHEIRIVLLQEVQNCLLCLTLVVSWNWNRKVGNSIEIRDRLIVRVVRNNQRNVASQFAAPAAIKQVHQAVVVLRDQYDHLRAVVRPSQTPLHLEVVGDRSEVPGEVRQVDVKLGRIKFHAHQEQVRFIIGVLVSVQDVSVMAEDKIGDRGNDALAVGTTNQKYSGVLHSVETQLAASFCLSLQVLQYLPRRVGTGTPGQPRPRMRPRAAQVQVLNWHAVPGPIKQRTHGKELVERKFTVENVASRESVGIFQILRRDDLVRQNQFRKPRGVLRQRPDNSVAQRDALAVPIGALQLVGRVLHIN